MPVSQSDSNLAINTPLGDDVVVIVSATITEQLGRLFSIDLELSSDDPALDFSAVVGGNSTIRLELDGSTRYWNGYVSRFVQTEADSSVGGRYRATLVPWLWFLTRTADCRIFQAMTVPDIIKQVFRDQGFTDFKDSLTGTYTAWENCVQYRETDFNFVSRLMEHEGIYYFFTHENGKHTLVLADNVSAHTTYPNYDTINFRTGRGGVAASETITGWTLEQEVQPGAYSLNDFNFETPKTSLLAKSQISTPSAQSSFEVYDYPGEYSVQGDGTDYSQIRIEELHSQYEIVHGVTNARGVAAGYTFTLANSPRKDQNRSYLVTSASYHLSGYKYGSGGDGGEGELYTCNFTAIDSTKPFRSARITPKPLIQGPQTAIVVGPSGEEIHTDKYGRIVVQFHWDRYGKADENSSCWVRISQAAWAGKKYGALYIPRVGQEVIVEFLEGDPDLPIVTGRVYNADAMPPYDLPAEKTKTTLKSASSKGADGFNELRFEDKKGSEQVFIHGEKNLDVRIKNNAYEWIGNDQHLIVKQSLTEHVELDHHELIDRDHVEEVKRDLNTKIGGKEAKLVISTLSLEVDDDVAEVFKANQSTTVTKNHYLKADNIVIEALTNVTIKVGSSYIAIEAGGIKIGTTGTLELESTGPLSAKSQATANVESLNTTVKGSAMVTVQAPMAELKGDGLLTISGGLVSIN